MRYKATGLLILLLFTCCKRQEIPWTEVHLTNGLAYSFLVCGHTYGQPDHYGEGLYEAFQAFFPFINDYPGMALGMFTGDVNPTGEDKRWDPILEDMAELSFPTWIAPGNHDLGFHTFYNRFGYFYTAFFHQTDLFIILTPNLDRWNISGQQMEFLQKSLRNDGKQARNIFVFHHELLWYSRDNQFSGIRMNGQLLYPGSTNFFDEVLPLFEDLGKPAYFFAGDVGANDRSTPYMYYNDGLIHLIASGMGSGTEDNFLIAEVMQDGQVKLQLCAMQGEINRFGDLTEYILP